MSDDHSYDEFVAMVQQYERQKAEQVSAEFTQLDLHVCHQCGAVVLNREQHHGFHEALKDWTVSAGKAFEEIAQAMSGKPGDKT
jgi:hypothetical protein